MTCIGLFGADGRMGRAIADVAAARGDVLIGGKDPAVFVDFTAPDALETNLSTAVSTGRPIVIGTTGLDRRHHKKIDAAARQIAVLQAANMSLGVAMLAHLVNDAAARLGADWDIEIVEMHHRHKVDAPSGTALLLGASAAEGRGSTLQA
ncbi:MAG: 4-hydroxy-tetrahydrodipicolinate reductase, partial [Alphaproteobacteria bacterium]|nr:4-hydroxy-tetrahydrodipicolinate reductase [Alphaproteobacteria bacterium]